MRQARPFKPAPKNAAANRIRERYLHQLGLQRGAGAPLPLPHSNHVVVISGLPSLPEDRATTEHVMESHDFSISKNSQHTGATPPGSVGANSTGENDDGEMSGSGGSSAQDNNHPHDAAAASAPSPADAHSHSSKSPLSLSPIDSACRAGDSLTSMALLYPTALRKVPHPADPTPPPSNSDSNSITVPFSLSNPLSWRTMSLSKPATVLLDSAEYQRGNDQDSVSSAGTCTTAESSLTAAMVSRDWGNAPPATASAGMSTSSLQGSPASTTGVYFQCGRPHLLGSHIHVTKGGQCATSSLSHALNRFNIDSDCEASVASNSIVEDHLMDEDDASCDDTASLASHTSTLSSASHHNIARAAGGRKKIGKTQRLMDRAAAHDRILQRRSDRSQKMRASLVHSQRMGDRVSISGLSSAMTNNEAPPQRSESPGSTSSSQASIPLVHVQHGSGGSQATVSQVGAQETHLGGYNLGRTPTASNCTDLRRQLKDLGCTSEYLDSLPQGVHIVSAGGQGRPMQMAPLGFHPRLASRIPTPPFKLSAQGTMMPSNSETDQAGSAAPMSSSTEEVESGEVEDSTPPSLQHMTHDQAADYDSVMEVALTLSKLGGERAGPIPRFR